MPLSELERVELFSGLPVILVPSLPAAAAEELFALGVSSRGRSMRLLHVFLLALFLASVSCDRSPLGQPSAKTEGGGQVEWVDPKTIQPGPIRWDALSDEQMSRIRALQAVFVEVDGQTVEQWVDNFKRDADPDKELQVWERMAKAYRAYCDGKKLSAVAKSDVYRVVLLRSMASEQDVLERVKLNELSGDDAIAVMKGFKVGEAAAP